MSNNNVLAEHDMLETIDDSFSVGTWDAKFRELNKWLDVLLGDNATIDIAGSIGPISMKSLREHIAEDCRSLDISGEGGISANLALLTTELIEWDEEFADMLAREPIDLSQDLSIVLTCATTMKCALGRLFRECDALRKLAWANRKFYTRLEKELDDEVAQDEGGSFEETVDGVSDDIVSEEESIDEVVDELIEESIDAIVENSSEIVEEAFSSEPSVDEHPVDGATAALSNLIRACSRDNAPVAKDSVFLGTVTHEEEAVVIMDDEDDMDEFIPNDVDDIPVFDTSKPTVVGEDEDGMPLILIDDEIDPNLSVMFQDMIEEQRMLEQLEARQSMDPDEYYAYILEQSADEIGSDVFAKDFDEDAFAESVKTKEQRADELLAEEMSRTFDIPAPTLTAVVSHEDPVIVEEESYIVEEPVEEKDDLSRMVETALSDTGTVSREQAELIAEDAGVSVDEVIASAMNIKNDRAFADKPDLKTEPH